MQERSALAQQRALDRIWADELARMEREEKEARQKVEAEKMERIQAQLSAEQQASKILSNLKPAFIRRVEASEKLYTALVDFMAANDEIRAGMSEAENVIAPHINRLDNYLRTERRELVRRNSGLPFNDSDIANQLPRNTAGDMAYVIAYSIVHNAITPGGLNLGGRIASIKRD